MGLIQDALDLARALQASSHARAEGTALPADHSPALALYDELVLDPDLRGATRALYRDGHYTRSVEEGCKALIDLVKRRSGLAADGTPLMEAAFSEKNPRLRINRLRSQADRDEQVGYQRMFAGAILAVRNPRAHDGKRSDDADSALSLLVLVQHLFVIARRATRTRQRSP